MEPDTIYLCWANTEYEGGDVFAAYLDREAADALVERCRAFKDQSRPPEFKIDFTDEEFDAYCEADKAFRAGFPAGPDFVSYDTYSVTAMPITSAPPKPTAETKTAPEGAA